MFRDCSPTERADAASTRIRTRACRACRAAVVGNTGIAAIWALGTLMIAFYITCVLFIVGVLGTLLYVVTRVNIFSLIKYLAREYVLIVGTSSSESGGRG